MRRSEDTRPRFETAKGYDPPVLVELGTLKELTLGFGTNVSDEGILKLEISPPL